MRQVDRLLAPAGDSSVGTNDWRRPYTRVRHDRTHSAHKAARLVNETDGFISPTFETAARRIWERERRENFPVALWFLPRQQRFHLRSVYGFARLVDEIGDEAPGDRIAQLEWIEADLRRATTGQALHPLVQRLSRTLRALSLPLGLLHALIEANRQDQLVPRYDTFEQLLSYCALSANPIGRLVLHIFGLVTKQRVALSDLLCTGLQLAEHWQDVREDLERGRVYLPKEDLDRFGCCEQDLCAPAASPALRQLMRFEAQRAHQFLRASAPLLRGIPVRPRLAIAAFGAGGQAALDAIAHRNFDVLAGSPRPRRARLLLRAVQILWSSRTVISAEREG